MRVVLTAPVWPTMATVSPGSMAKLTSPRTQSGSDDSLDPLSPDALMVSSEPLPELSSPLSAGTSRYADQTGSNSMRPGPAGGFLATGEKTSTRGSASLEMQ